MLVFINFHKKNDLVTIALDSEKKAKCLIDGDVRDENCKGGAGKRNAARDRNKLWHTRQIPYVLHSSLSKQSLIDSCYFLP